MQISQRYRYRRFVVPSSHLRPHLGGSYTDRGRSTSHSVKEARVGSDNTIVIQDPAMTINTIVWSLGAPRDPRSPVTWPHKIPQIRTADRSECKGGRTLVLYL